MRQTCTSSPKKEGVAAPNLHGEPEKRRGRCAKPARRAGKKKGAVRQTCTTSLAQEPPTPPRALFDPPNFSPRPEIFSRRPTLERPRADETSRPSFGGKASGPRKPEQLQATRPLGRARPDPAARVASVGSRATVQDLDAVQILNTGCPCACIASGKAPRADVGGRGRLHRRRGGGRARNVDGGCDAAFRRLPAAARKAGKGAERRRWMRPCEGLRASFVSVSTTMSHVVEVECCFTRQWVSSSDFRFCRVFEETDEVNANGGHGRIDVRIAGSSRTGESEGGFQIGRAHV